MPNETKLYVGYRDQDGNPSKPTTKQEIARALLFDKVNYLLLHGTTQSGKTTCATWLPALWAIENKRPGVNVLACHEKIALIESSIIDSVRQLFPEKVDIDGKEFKIIDHNRKSQYIKITLPDPSLIHPMKGYTLCYYLRPLLPEKRLYEKIGRSGLRAGFLIVDQIEILKSYGPHVLSYLLTRLSQEPGKAIYTANPENKNFWIEKNLPQAMSEEIAVSNEYAAILMVKGDNAENVREGYHETLIRELPTALADRFGRGMYTNLTGRCYDDFHYLNHVSDIRFPLDENWKVWEANDYGYNDSSVHGWFGLHIPTNKIYLLADIRCRRETPGEVAAKVLDRRYEILGRMRTSTDYGPWFLRAVGDPAMFNKKQDGSKSIAAQFRDDYVHPITKERVYLIPARTAGLPDKCRTFTRIMLANGLFKTGSLFINKAATEFIREEQDYVWEDPQKAADTPVSNSVFGTDGNIDHHWDAMKMFSYGISDYALNELNIGVNKDLETKDDSPDYGRPSPRASRQPNKFNSISVMMSRMAGYSRR